MKYHERSQFEKMTHFIVGIVFSENDEYSFDSGHGYSNKAKAEKSLNSHKGFFSKEGVEYAILTRKKVEEYFGQFELVPDTDKIMIRRDRECTPLPL